MADSLLPRVKREEIKKKKKALKLEIGMFLSAL
jgi:hypothetical protein